MNFKCASIIVAFFINLNINKIHSNEENVYNQSQSDLSNLTLIDKNTNFLTGLDYIRLKRAAPRDTTRPECNITKDILVGLRSEIKETMKNITKKPNTATCTLNFDNADDCDSLVSLLQCGFNHILEGFNNAKQHSTPQSEYDQLKNAYYRLNETANTMKDNAGRNIKQLLQKIDHLVNINDQQTILLCASEIDSGRIESALMEYNKIADQSSRNLHKIIETSFTYRQNNSNILLVVDRVTKFIENLPLSEMLIGIEQLLQTIKSTNDARYMRSIYKNLHDFKNIKETVKQNLKTQLKFSDLEQIIEYSEIGSEIYNGLLKKLITDIFFRRLDNQKLLKFIADLPNLTHKFICYEILQRIIIWVN